MIVLVKGVFDLVVCYLFLFLGDRIYGFGGEFIVWFWLSIIYLGWRGLW